jgi:hypothetical protein
MQRYCFFDKTKIINSSYKNEKSNKKDLWNQHDRFADSTNAWKYPVYAEENIPSVS